METTWLEDRDQETLERFRSYIRDEIIPLAVPEDPETDPKERNEIIERLLDNKAMARWVAAFTHRSFDANKDRNLEFFEFFGDNAAGYAFAFELMKNHPLIDEEKATLLKNHYLKDEIQAEWGTKLRVEAYIWTYIKPTFKDVEDIFESMFGTFAALGESITPGMGGLLIFNFMASYVETLHIDPAQIRKDPKTAIKEYFDGSRGWVTHPWKPSDLVKRIGRGETDFLQFFLPERAIAEISAEMDLGRDEIPTPFVEISVPRSVKKDMPAFKAAADKLLDEYGINVYVEPSYGAFTEEATKAAVKEGYVRLELSKFERKENEKTYYQMLGIRVEKVEGKGKEEMREIKSILAALYVSRGVGISDAKKVLSGLYTKNGADPRPYERSTAEESFRLHTF